MLPSQKKIEETYTKLIINIGYTVIFLSLTIGFFYVEQKIIGFISVLATYYLFIKNVYIYEKYIKQKDTAKKERDTEIVDYFLEQLKYIQK